jgi:hypothetical protein
MILHHDLLENKRTRDIFQSLPKTPRIIDVGCGVRPCPAFKCEEYICIEPHQEYVDVLKGWRAPAPSFQVIRQTAEAIEKLPRKGSTVFLLDVIEHMERPAGEGIKALLEEFDHAVVFTPYGWHEQGEQNPDPWGYNGGYWQKHRSAWYPEDFAGWVVHSWNHWHAKQSTGAILAVR